MPTLIVLLFLQLGLSAQSLTISITGLRNNKGTVIMGFYNNDKAFEDETPLFTKVESKVNTVNHVLTINYKNFKPGTYGIVILDDENNNGKMDYGWILPEEGYGFSNYWHTSLTKPKVAKFSFTIAPTENKAVEIKVKYW